MKTLLAFLVVLSFSSMQAAEPITFANLKSRIEDIPQVAWTNTQQLLKSNRASSTSVIDLEILIGPNTKLYFEDNESAFVDGMTLWANVKRPTKYIAFFYCFEDKSWAYQQYKKLPFYKPGMEILIDGPCDGTKCTGANSGIQSFSSVGVGVFGIHGPDAKDPYRRGPMQIHEYTHAVQMAPWIGKDHPGSEQQKISPCWLIEGQAHFAGISAGTTSFEKYQQIRKQQVQSHKVDSFTEYSSATILDYYNSDIPNQCLRSPNYRLGYTLGFLTVEALSAIGGIESSMNVYQLAASGQSFNRSFKNVYGIAWKDAKPILAEVVALMRKKIVD